MLMEINNEHMTTESYFALSVVVPTRYNRQHHSSCPKKYFNDNAIIQRTRIEHKVQQQVMSGDITLPTDNQSYLYVFYCHNTQMYYVGYKSGGYSDIYCGSSHGEQYWKDFTNLSYRWSLDIVSVGTQQEMSNLESKYLTNLFDSKAGIFWNSLYNTAVGGVYSALSPERKQEASKKLSKATTRVVEIYGIKFYGILKLCELLNNQMNRPDIYRQLVDDLIDNNDQCRYVDYPLYAWHYNSQTLREFKDKKSLFDEPNMLMGGGKITTATWRERKRIDPERNFDTKPDLSDATYTDEQLQVVIDAYDKCRADHETNRDEIISNANSKKVKLTIGSDEFIFKSAISLSRTLDFSDSYIKGCFRCPHKWADILSWADPDDELTTLTSDVIEICTKAVSERRYSRQRN